MAKSVSHCVWGSIAVLMSLYVYPSTVYCWFSSIKYHLVHLKMRKNLTENCMIILTIKFWLTSVSPLNPKFIIHVIQFFSHFLIKCKNVSDNKFRERCVFMWAETWVMDWVEEWRRGLPWVDFISRKWV